MEIVKIGEKIIGEGQPVFVIAEIGINHNGDFETAKKMIEMAKCAGASAVKLQTYITEKRVHGNSPIFDILKQCELSFLQQEELFKYASALGIIIFSTPFDDESVDFLNSINIPCYKIASFDLVNTQFIKKIVAKGKPVIMSRGMSNQQEIDEAVDIVKSSKVDFIIMHCVSAYPVTSHTSLNLKMIQALKDRYQCPVGFSDHTIGIKASKYAVAGGASVIEKHFTLSRQSKCPDHAISAEPAEMKEMISAIKYVQEIMGGIIWSSIPEEKDILQYRRFS